MTELRVAMNEVPHRRLLLLLLLGLLLLAGCQTLGNADSVATIDVDLTLYAAESDQIKLAATAEQEAVLATLISASTRVAELSVVNAALGATLRANYTATPELRAVVVSADDMGNSLVSDMSDMMDNGAESDANALTEETMRVSNLSTALGTDPNSGCSTGIVRQFSPEVTKIYVTARVTALRTGSNFDVQWLYEGREVYRFSWQAPYSSAFDCIWFYVTPTDFPFLPGNYAATLFVNAEPVGTTTFTIDSN